MTNETEHVDIDMALFCPQKHHVGNLPSNQPRSYHPRSGRPPMSWPPHPKDPWWEVSCPRTGAPASFSGWGCRKPSPEVRTGSRLTPTDDRVLHPETRGLNAEKPTAAARPAVMPGLCGAPTFAVPRTHEENTWPWSK